MTEARTVRNPGHHQISKSDHMSGTTNSTQERIAEEYVKQFILLMKNNLKVRNMIRVVIRTFDDQDLKGDLECSDKKQDQKAKKAKKPGRR